MTTRSLIRSIPSVVASDGAGVRLRRSLGKDPFSRVDPFLMLDAFSSENPDDYVAGFPPHPHRGFETVTYMLDGHMRHEDSLGHRGELRSGGVQWMTAGRGVIHSEMPQQERGRMRGFQLWINLPAAEKMTPARYRNIEAAEIPTVSLPGNGSMDGGSVKVIAGAFDREGTVTDGPIQGRSTQPVYWDVSLPAGAHFSAVLPEHLAVLVYPYEGALIVGEGSEQRLVPAETLGVLGRGDALVVRANGEPARFLVLAGRPLGEPVVQYGPFVMNTREEIEQAIADYRDGVLA